MISQSGVGERNARGSSTPDSVIALQPQLPDVRVHVSQAWRHALHATSFELSLVMLLFRDTSDFAFFFAMSCASVAPGSHFPVKVGRFGRVPCTLEGTQQIKSTGLYFRPNL